MSKNKKYCSNENCEQQNPQDLVCFHKDKYTKDGLTTRCKCCRNKEAKERNKTSYNKFKEKRKELNRKYYYDHRCERIKYGKQYFENNKDKILESKKEYGKKYRKENKEKIKEYNKKYRKENKEKIKEYGKKYRESEGNKKRSCENVKRYKKSEKGRKIIREYEKNRRKNDSCYHLRKNFSNSVRRSLKFGKSCSCFDNLPYTLEQLRQHLESQFESWMNWDNYGGWCGDNIKNWHIDHIIPVSSFIFSSEKDEEFQRCWALENLRPLEKMKNLIKRDKISE